MRTRLHVALIVSYMMALLYGCSAGTVVVSPSTDAESYVPWYRKHQLVAHAMGAVDGVVSTNSLEAFEYNYERGTRVFEVDLIRAADGVLVARHDWEVWTYDRLLQEYDSEIYPTPDSATFLDTPISRKLTPLTVYDLADLLRRYPDAYLITDTKESEPDKYAFAIDSIVDAFGDTVDRVIPQAYSYENYTWVTQLGIFPEVIFTLYQMPEDDDENIAAWCKAHGVKVVCIYYGVYTDISAEYYNDADVFVYLHTLNDVSEIVRYREQGAYGFYTDTINETEHSGITAFLSQSSYIRDP